MEIKTKSIECSIYSRKQLRENSLVLKDFDKLPNIVLSVCGIEKTESNFYHVAVHNTDVSKGAMVDLADALRKQKIVISSPFAMVEQALIELSRDKKEHSLVKSSLTAKTISVRLSPTFELFAFPEEEAAVFNEKEKSHICGTGRILFSLKPYAFVIRYRPIVPDSRRDSLDSIKEFSLSKIFHVEELKAWIQDKIHSEFPFIEENFLLQTIEVN